MTKAQYALKVFLSDVTSGSQLSKVAEAAGISRQMLSYLRTLQNICSSEEFVIIKKAINKNIAVQTTTGEATKSLEGLVRIVKTGARPIEAEQNTPMIVYLLRSGDSTKIGIAKSISNRIKILQTGNPNTITLLCEFKYSTETECREIEKHLHTRFNAKHIRGEWYDLDDIDIQTIITVLNTKVETNVQ
jgi:hypothetical protein